jgi:hypothetical protein
VFVVGCAAGALGRKEGTTMTVTMPAFIGDVARLR